MMDEQLIDEVAQHGVIFNRQKYYLNGGGGGPGITSGKYETKDEAWQVIAIKLHTDVETCKKRWKYLRERYVSQRKQGDPPCYEHLSRPYLEKMKFLDQHIQPRKSYRSVPNFLTSPHGSSYSECNMDSRSNGSMKAMNHFSNSSAAAQHHYQQQQQQQQQHQQQYEQQHSMKSLGGAAAAVLENTNGYVKLEADVVFRDFAAAVASQQLQLQTQSHLHHQQAEVGAPGITEGPPAYQAQQFRESGVAADVSTANGASLGDGGGGGGASSSSSMKSPLSSPLANVVNGTANGLGVRTSTPQNAATTAPGGHLQAGVYNDAHSEELNSSAAGTYNTKKPRVQLNSHAALVPHGSNGDSHHPSNTNHNHAPSNAHFGHDTDDESDENSNGMLQPQPLLPDAHDVHFPAAASVPPRGGGQQQPPPPNVFPSNADFLFQLYKQLPHPHTPEQSQKFQTNHAAPTFAPPQRCSEHLLGELVTTELLKMSKDRRKVAQKRILEILFFDD